MWEFQEPGQDGSGLVVAGAPSADTSFSKVDTMQGGWKRNLEREARAVREGRGDCGW